LVGSSTSGIWGLVLIGTEANMAGNAGPDTMFSIAVLFVATFLMALFVLKILGYVAAELVSRPQLTKL